MNIENKKTALDDDAGIYQGLQSKETSKSDRQKLSELSFKGKLRYLWDYYALIAGLVLFFGGLIIAALVIMLKPKPNTVANYAIIDSPWKTTTVQSYSEVVLWMLNKQTKKNEIVMSDGYSSGNSTDSLAISTHIYAGEVDFIIAPIDTIQLYADNSIFYALDSLPESLQDEIREFAHVSSDKAEDEGTHDYAFCLTGSGFDRFVNSDDPSPAEMYVGFCRTSDPEKYDDMIKVLRFMATGDIPK